MKVDFFKNKTSVIPVGRPKDVMYYLERIKDGAVEKTVTLCRSKMTKKERDLIKGELSAVTFCGTFNTRAKNGLKKGSGLSILDFDNLTYEETLELKEKLKSNQFIFSVWLSPSGLGLKALVKIPEVTSNDEYNSYYKALINDFEWIKNEYNDKVIDTSGQDVSRLCFESYDPDIYINLDSELFTKFQIKEVEISSENLGVVTNIPLTDQDEIANRLMIWFKKHYKGHERNNSFYKLAIAFNDFGVFRHTAERYILPNAQKDFPESEILSLISSAYKQTANFGTKTFEDKVKAKAIKSMALVGKTENEIIDKFKDIDAEKIKQELSIVKRELNVEEFWHYDFEGKLKISPHKFKFYLENKNFYKHYPLQNSKTFTFITKEDNFVDEVSEFQIKDFVLDSLLLNAQLEPFDLLAASTKSFTPAFLSMLSTAQFTIEEDDSDSAWIYYKNVALKVTKEKREMFEYSDLNGFVWKKQVIQRDWIQADHHESEYRTFLWHCASKDTKKYNSLKSVIGYLMHSHKTSANNKAIVFNDETISDNPNGGSGKSLFWNALSHVKKVASIDGKNFEFSKSFPYQSVPTDTQLLVFDDVKRNFNFENLFSLITEGITLEYKGQDAIKLPVSKSPKIIITTNYTINGVGGSFERRKFEVEMSSYFNANHSPLDEFKHMLFDDWDTQEWARFDHFMINCLEFYLENGLVDFPHMNLDNRKLINETSSDFLEWIKEENVLIFGNRINKNDFFDKFVNENKDYIKHLKQKRFTIWIQKYCSFYGYRYSEGNSNGNRWFMVEKVNPVTLQYETKEEEISTLLNEIGTPPKELTINPDISFDNLEEDDLPF
jgi:hypothetical protein